MQRREFIRQIGLGMIAVSAGAGQMLLTPRQARAQGAAFKVLEPGEVTLLEAFADVLVPGAAEEGVAHFIDFHLAQPPADSLLMIRYLDIPPPHDVFYRAGLGNLAAVSQREHKKAFTELSDDQRHAMVKLMSRQNPPGWEGFPAPLFYFALRADAVDVVYGTQEGFEKLGVPYMAHIEPPTPW